MNMYALCRKFWELGVVEISILDLVLNLGEFNGNYSEMAREIGKDPSATRKAVLRLESIGMLTICKTQTAHMEKMIRCTLNENWTRNLLNS